MSGIPFGMVGAVWGHVMMGFDLSLMSMLGLDRLVRRRGQRLAHPDRRRSTAIAKKDGLGLWEAVLAGGARRFRPILLTSLTTFFGLAPMILETSVQARFLIPMAVSLGFGVLAGTFIMLLIVPCGYLILEDARQVRAGTSARRLRGNPTVPPPGAAEERKPDALTTRAAEPPSHLHCAEFARCQSYASAAVGHRLPGPPACASTPFTYSLG